MHQKELNLQECISNMGEKGKELSLKNEQAKIILKVKCVTQTQRQIYICTSLPNNVDNSEDKILKDCPSVSKAKLEEIQKELKQVKLKNCIYFKCQNDIKIKIYLTM